MIPVKSIVKNTISDLQHTLDETQIYTRSVCRQSTAQSHFIIFAQGRTGTWLLHDLLNQHPAIHCDKEILEQRVRFPTRYVLGMSKLAPQPVYGCHIQINQLLNTQCVDPYDFLQNFHHERGWQIIYLRRNDIVRQSISAIVAVQRQEWVVFQKHDKKQSFEIDIDKVLKRIQRRIEHLELEQRILDDIPHLHLVYETNLQSDMNHQDTMNEIFSFLGQDPISVQAHTKKILPPDLSTLIINYDSLMEQVERNFGTLAKVFYDGI